MGPFKGAVPIFWLNNFGVPLPLPQQNFPRCFFWGEGGVFSVFFVKPSGNPTEDSAIKTAALTAHLAYPWNFLHMEHGFACKLVCGVISSCSRDLYLGFPGLAMFNTQP